MYVAPALMAASTCSAVSTVPAPTTRRGSCAISSRASAARAVRKVTSAQGRPPSASASPSGRARSGSSRTITGTIPMSWIRAIVSVTSFLTLSRSAGPWLLQHPGEGFDEEVLAPHHALVDAEPFPLVVGAVLERAFPAGFVRGELRL